MLEGLASVSRTTTKKCVYKPVVATPTPETEAGGTPQTRLHGKFQAGQVAERDYLKETKQ